MVTFWTLFLTASDWFMHDMTCSMASLSLPYKVFHRNVFIRIACTTSLCKHSAFVLILERKTLLACYHKIYVELIQSICCNLCASRAFLSIAIWIFYTHPLAHSPYLLYIQAAAGWFVMCSFLMQHYFVAEIAYSTNISDRAVKSTASDSLFIYLSLHYKL